MLWFPAEQLAKLLGTRMRHPIKHANAWRDKHVV